MRAETKKHKSDHGNDTTYYYAPDIAQLPELPSEEATHAVRVLRKSIGDEIFVTDGQGSLYQATLLSNDPKGALLQATPIITPGDSPMKAGLTLAIAPTKNIDRIEWLAEKATEIGMQRLCLVHTERTLRERINLERIDKIIISAMKQSRHLYKPQLLQYPSLAAFLSARELPIQRFIAHCDSNDAERRYLPQQLEPRQDALVLIGPEGDFSSQEVAQARAAGCVAVSLGSSRLRTETAGLYAAMAFSIINQH